MLAREEGLLHFSLDHVISPLLSTIVNLKFALLQYSLL
jgi:hypothetical protein